MIWKRILAAITVILVVAAIVLMKRKANQMPKNTVEKEIRK